jgi:hypothetical protein
MPKPIPKRASPTFTIRGNSLKSETVNHLLTLLGYPDYDLRQEALEHQLPGFQVDTADPGAPLILKRQPPNLEGVAKKDLGAVVRSIELAIGLYVDGSIHLDEIPRAADYSRIFKSLQDDALKLLIGLTGLGGYYRDQFALKNVEIHNIELAMRSLIDVCTAVQKDMKGQSSKGAPVNRALIVTIKELLKIFRSNACASAKRNEVNFVKFALVEAKILKPLPANKDNPAEQREIDFTKKVARHINQADKSTVSTPRRI